LNCRTASAKNAPRDVLPLRICADDGAPSPGRSSLRASGVRRARGCARGSHLVRPPRRALRVSILKDTWSENSDTCRQKHLACVARGSAQGARIWCASHIWPFKHHSMVNFQRCLVGKLRHISPKVKNKVWGCSPGLASGAPHPPLLPCEDGTTF
jgi:hypothetical protein